ncbi:MAG TPA: transcription termination/antitermination protein NusG [Candidatus Acidoferrales bacterium]|nr:transcription termination/antitermination protein NusG [Candidatus Acidoferrales bacterium]
MEKKWYAIYVQPGYEQRVQAALKKKIKEAAKEHLFGEVLVPTEKIIDRVKGKKQTVERRLFPGYVLVQMVMTDENWHFIHSIPRVLGFVGEGNTPTPMSDREVEEIMRTVESSKAAPRPKTRFVVGERVKVVDGPFRDFAGTVQEVRPERSMVRVAISVFGRPTPVDLDFVQVEAA